MVATLFCGVLALAQTETITGTVVDSNNEPIIGAALIDVATKNGVVTDMDGQFTINVSPGANLEVSCLGYTTVSVKAHTLFPQ